MKKGLLFFLFFLTISSYAQTVVKGKITSTKNKPLVGASVYFNNTTTGTITNEKGEFYLKVKKGNYTLIVSFLGYKIKQIPINSSERQPFFNIQLKEDNTILNEVVI